MSSETALLELESTSPSPAAAPMRRRIFSRSLTPHGEPLVWLSGGALAFALLMIVGLLGLILYQGLLTFWPLPIVRVTTASGAVLMGEVSRIDQYRLPEATLRSLDPAIAASAENEAKANEGFVRRRLLRTGNFDLTGTHFHWVSDFEIIKEDHPDTAMIVERLEWGRFYGTPAAFLIDGAVVASEPSKIWTQFNEYHDAARDRWRERVEIEKHELGAVSHAKNEARLAARRAELKYGADSAEVVAANEELARVEQWESEETTRLLSEIETLNAENRQYQMRLVAVDSQEKELALDEVVRMYPANQLSFVEKLGVYFSRAAEFLVDDPRQANSEGGVFPAIFGTVVMTLVMSLAVAPFGVLAALYLREYAKAGPIISTLRIAINNLAGVPSIVFGVFGLGFFCYVVGASMDQLFFSAELSENSPTFGTGGVLWASLTLALLTLPVVIVTTEEALAAVPSSMREGSYACGASKWQTIQRIVLPRAMPGIMTGMILAMARGAGEVAPLMLVGAVKIAPELPIDSLFPYVHAQRSFMHLGFHIFDLGFQSQNSEAAKPMVFTTTLLLISIITLLNITAIWLRGRLRRRFVSNAF
jgi:phosphate transport system permease protein